MDGTREWTIEVLSWGVQAIEPSLDVLHRDGWERPQTCQTDELTRGSHYHRQPLKRLAGLFQGGSARASRATEGASPHRAAENASMKRSS